MAIVCASSSSSITPPEKYEVFVSFRGEDVRQNFLSHLLAAFRRYQIEAYFDEETLERGDEISQALREAIQRSKISVIVFSKNYASSSWCLDELVCILECQKKYNQIVLPIFYNVDPSDVRKQGGTYAEAFRKHEENYKDKMEMVQKWRDTLTESGGLAGWNSCDISPESRLVEEIALNVLRKLNRNSSSTDFGEDLVGIKEPIEQIKLLLSKVQIVGIWGIGGVGKSTIAEAVFHQLSNQFESRCFLKNVREETDKDGLINLRNKLLDNIFEGENFNFGTSSLPDFIRLRLSRKKVLIVLDDVNGQEQVQELVDKRDWFHPESRIIITTRDTKVLEPLEVYKTYEVKELNYYQALQLFSLTAFKGKSPTIEYVKLSEKVLKYAGGLPLAIKILGSHLHSLCDGSIRDWEMILNLLKEDCGDKIEKVFRTSYDALHKIEKAIFLDIACFFKGNQRKFVENILNGCGFSASIRIDYLINKSLLTISSENEILMHDLVQEMGQNIVLQQSKKHGERSRLWIPKDAYQVLNSSEGTEEIEGIFMNMSQIHDKELRLRPEVFKNMRNLRLLKIYDQYDGDCEDIRKVFICQDLRFLPHQLSYLYWSMYPSKHLPSKFKPHNLVELCMPFSQLERLWDGVQDLNKLKTIDLHHSIYLTQIPDLLHATNIEKINLRGCKSLVQFPWHSLQNLDKLEALNLSDCKKLNMSTQRFDGRAIKYLNLQGCHSLVALPRIFTKLLPSSIDSLNNLSELKFSNYKGLTYIPSSICNLHSLKNLDLSGCSSLDTFPELPKNIERIDLSETAIKEVPSSSIDNCFSLEYFFMINCERLETFPTTIFKSRSLGLLSLDGCSNIKNFQGPEIPELVERSLEEARLSIFLGGTGIRELPSWFGNFTCVRGLSLSRCKNLEHVPESICNMKSLSMLRISSSSKLEYLPSTIGNLLSLKRLYCQGCSIVEIPPEIKLLSSLILLDIKNCKKIKSLPELPLSLEILEATGCTSLVSTSNRVVTTRFWDSLELDVSNRVVPYFPVEALVFYGCLELDENALHNILTDFQFRALRIATQINLKKCSGIYTCYPGNKIPKWFTYESEGSSIRIELPPNWRNANFLGFAVCVVVAKDSLLDHRSSLYCKVHLNPGEDFYSGEDEDFEWDLKFYGLTNMDLDFASDDHVLMCYYFSDYRYCVDAVEAKFQFFYERVRDRQDLVWTAEDWSSNIKQCGICLVYKDELISLLEKSVEIADQPESSAQAPPAKRIKYSHC